MKKTLKAGVIPQLSYADFRKQHASAMGRLAQVEAQPVALIANEGASIQPGSVYLANESVFTQQYFDEPLTNYATGWKDPNNIEATLEFFAPSVPVPRRFTYKSWTNIEEFLSEDAYDDLRAIGGEFPTVTYTGSEIHARTDNRGLRIRVDLDEARSPAASPPTRHASLRNSSAASSATHCAAPSPSSPPAPSILPRHGTAPQARTRIMTCSSSSSPPRRNRAFVPIASLGAIPHGPSAS